MTIKSFVDPKNNLKNQNMESLKLVPWDNENIKISSHKHYNSEQLTAKKTKLMTVDEKNAKPDSETELVEDPGSEYMLPNGSASDRSHINDSEEGENENLEDEHHIVSKNKTKIEHTWKQNVRKTKKLRGQTYTSAQRKIMPHKTFLPVVCKCFKKCHNFISDSKQKELHSKLYQFDKYDLQPAFLFGLIKVIDKKRVYTKNIDSSKRKFSREYYLPVENGRDEKVCKDFFKEIFFLSDGRISRLVKSKIVSNTPQTDQRG